MSLHFKPPRRNGVWQAGQSGNPKGSQRDRSLQELCRAHTEEAVRSLITMMRFKGPNQLPATLAILDRGHGKPTQRIETESDHLHLHLLAAQLVEALDAPQPQQEQRQPQVIDGSVPTE